MSEGRERRKGDLSSKAPYWEQPGTEVQGGDDGKEKANHVIKQNWKKAEKIVKG